MGGRIACLLFLDRLHSLVKSSREGSKEHVHVRTHKGKKTWCFFQRKYLWRWCFIIYASVLSYLDFSSIKFLHYLIELFQFTVILAVLFNFIRPIWTVYSVVFYSSLESLLYCLLCGGNSKFRVKLSVVQLRVENESAELQIVDGAELSRKRGGTG